jgi:hypothetical protein
MHPRNPILPKVRSQRLTLLRYDFRINVIFSPPDEEIGSWQDSAPRKMLMALVPDPELLMIRRRHVLRPFAACLLALFFLSPGRAAAQERYYLWVFSSQSTPKLPRYTHTWATFAKITDCAGRRTVEAFTISWYPATLHIRPYALRSEIGTNIDLLTTLRFVHSQGQRISVWGPYEIHATLYQSALGQKARLESGQVLYRMVDPILDGTRVSDCIHAVSDIDPNRPRILYPIAPFFGDAAGRRIAQVFRRNGLTQPPREDLRWLEPALGMAGYPIVRRD